VNKRKFLTKKRVMIIISIIVCMLFLISFIKFKNQFNCFAVVWSSFNKIDRNIYVQPNISDQNRKMVLDNISKAKDRVVKLCGSYNAKPTIIVCEDANMRKKFGMKNSTGMTQKTIVGTYVILGPDGMNIDVIAHELIHSELVYRFGWFKSIKTPIWFDDGLATQVDYRPQYSESEWINKTDNGRKVLEMSELDSPKQFYVSDLNTRILHYTLVKHELHRWLSIVGQNGLIELFDEVNKGKDIYKVYNEIESEYTNRDKNIITHSAIKEKDMIIEVSEKELVKISEYEVIKYYNEKKNDFIALANYTLKNESEFGTRPVIIGRDEEIEKIKDQSIRRIAESFIKQGMVKNIGSLNDEV